LIEEAIHKPAVEKFLLPSLSNEEIDLFIGALQKVNFQAQDVILRQGTTGDSFFILQQGKVDVRCIKCTKNGEENKDPDQEATQPAKRTFKKMTKTRNRTPTMIPAVTQAAGKAMANALEQELGPCIRSHCPGDSFGDLALLYNCQQEASYVAAEACLLWRIDCRTFRRIMKGQSMTTS
jgi:CRP-like cAMP-binding protein